MSYPCIEAYTISCFEKNIDYIKEDIKTYTNKTKNHKISKIDRYKIQYATIEMINKINKLGINDFEIDFIGKTNIKIFEKEEEIYKNKNNYMLISLISYILLDLGIITIKNNNA